jgi:proteasome assembly chaperone (PAC2) family protein
MNTPTKALYFEEASEMVLVTITTMILPLFRLLRASLICLMGLEWGHLLVTDRSLMDLESMANIKNIKNTKNMENTESMKEKTENLLIRTLHAYNGRLSLDLLATEELP